MSIPAQFPFNRLSQHFGSVRRAFPARATCNNPHSWFLRARPDPRRPGFTLVELLFVLLIFGVIATLMVPPMISSQHKLRVDAAVQQLAIDLARARSEAMKWNEPVTVAQTGTNTYTVARVADRELEANVAFGTGPATTVSFTSSGTLTPVQSRTMVVRLGNQTRRVVISSAGFARVQ